MPHSSESSSKVPTAPKVEKKLKRTSTRIVETLASKTTSLSPEEAIDVYRGTPPTKAPKHIKAPPSVPIFRNTFDLINNSHNFVLKSAEDYGMVFRSNFFFRDNIFLLGGDAFQYVTEDPEKIFSAGLGTEAFLSNMFPNSLLSDDFSAHRVSRRVLQGAFKKDSLVNYLDAMNPLIEQFIAKWNTGAGNYIEFYGAVKSMVLNLATASLLGLELGERLDKVNKAYLDIVKGCTAIIQYPLPGTTLRRGFKARAYATEFLQELIDERRAKPGSDMISLLCQAEDDEGNRFTDVEIIDHILGMIFAAHDTTTSSMNSIMFALNQHPKWQDELLEEYQQFDSKYADYDITTKLEKTAWVFKEATRLYSPVGAIIRRNIRPFEWDGYEIPENCWVYASIHWNHMSEEYWRNPRSFDPERFNDERAEHKNHRYAWCPFGGGVHKCIGMHFAEMQIKAILFQLLPKYRMAIKPGFVPEHTFVPVMMPKKGLPISFTQRH